eukprot:1150400-Pelagomonas_calceolata.AAC.7
MLTPCPWLCSPLALTDAHLEVREAQRGEVAEQTQRASSEQARQLRLRVCHGQAQLTHAECRGKEDKSKSRKMRVCHSKAQLTHAEETKIGVRAGNWRCGTAKPSSRALSPEEKRIG